MIEIRGRPDWGKQPRNNGKFAKKQYCKKCGNELFPIKKLPKKNRFRGDDDGNYVYFFKCENFVKIGRSKNPFKRIENLKTANPFETTILFHFYSEVIKEDTLHLFFYDFGKYHRNEWFFFDNFTERVIEILEIYIKSIQQIINFKNGKYSSRINHYIYNFKKYKKNLRFIKNVENYFLGSYKKNR